MSEALRHMPRIEKNQMLLESLVDDAQEQSRMLAYRIEKLSDKKAIERGDVQLLPNPKLNDVAYLGTLNAQLQAHENTVTDMIIGVSGSLKNVSEDHVEAISNAAHALKESIDLVRSAFHIEVKEGKVLPFVRKG